MKSRLIEVALWIKSIIATIALLIAMFLVLFAGIEGDAETIFAIWIMCLTIALCIYGITWTGNYVISGNKSNVAETLKLVFGSVHRYFWFTLFFLYFGGIAGVAFAIVRGETNTVLLWNVFAESIGATFAVFLLGCLGRLYWPNRFLGHVIGAFIISIFAIFSLQYG